MTRKKHRKLSAQAIDKRRKNESLKKKEKKNETIFFVLFFLFLCLMLFSYKYYRVYNNNSIRETVEINPTNTKAIITEIRKGRGPNYAKYEFDFKGKKYYGETFYSYEGKLDDSICIDFSTTKPEINRYCEDKPIENLYDGVLLPVSIASLLLLVYFIFRLLTRDK